MNFGVVPARNLRLAIALNRPKLSTRVQSSTVGTLKRGPPESAATNACCVSTSNSMVGDCSDWPSFTNAPCALTTRSRSAGNRSAPKSAGSVIAGLVTASAAYAIHCFIGVVLVLAACIRLAARSRESSVASVGITTSGAGSSSELFACTGLTAAGTSAGEATVVVGGSVAVAVGVVGAVGAAVVAGAVVAGTTGGVVVDALVVDGAVTGAACVFANALFSAVLVNSTALLLSVAADALVFACVVCALSRCACIAASASMSD